MFAADDTEKQFSKSRVKQATNLVPAILPYITKRFAKKAAPGQPGSLHRLRWVETFATGHFSTGYLSKDHSTQRFNELSNKYYLSF